MSAVAMLAALAIDAAVGWPDSVYRRVGHPVTWLGALIARIDRRLNRESEGDSRRRAFGVLAALLVIAAAAGPAAVIEAALPSGVGGVVLAAILAWPLLAARSLHDHVAAVAAPLRAGDLAGARRAVAKIVGRDPDRLDDPGVARAALESLAENASDGVVAPVFWGVLLGLPGLAGYKAINTLDSMIGHKTERHRAFGWASARIDDLANAAPARLTGLLLALASAAPGRSIRIMRQDARRHRSPNAGWPEAALAGGLGVRLSGPRAYGDGLLDEPWLNGGAPDPTAGDISRGLTVCRRAAAMLALLLALVALT